jgi:hypothetical protein
LHLPSEGQQAVIVHLLRKAPEKTPSVHLEILKAPNKVVDRRF